MKRESIYSVAGVIAIVTTLVVFVAHAQQGRLQPVPRVVTNDEKAFLLLPPELIAAPVITHVDPSGDGKYVLVQRMQMKLNPASLTPEGLQALDKAPPPIEQQIILWDSKSKESRVVWRGNADVHVSDLGWLKGSSVAMGIVTQMSRENPADVTSRMNIHYSLLRVSAASDKAQQIPLQMEDEGTSFALIPSPVESITFLHKFYAMATPEGVTMNHAISLIKSDGRTVMPLSLDGLPKLHMITFDSVGSPVVWAIEPRVPGLKISKKYYLVDTRNASLKPYPGEFKDFQEITRPRNVLQRERLTLKTESTIAKLQETTQRVNMLWLEGVAASESPRTLVASDVGSSQFMPGGDGIVFEASGALWFAPMARMTLEQFKEMRENAQRQVALSNGKQLALGLIMYAQDYDEMLPSPDGVNTKVAPYIQNAELFNSFTYSYAGGPLKDIQNPVETELGYVTGPGGRAIMYVDGHVKWRKD
ncbi:MAG: hypothetical protein ABJA67_10765 [Chthonomonadales bacterium]